MPAKKPRPAAKSQPYSYLLHPMEPKEIRQLPETELSKRGMTLRQLLHSTPRLMINNAADVDIISLKMTKTKSGMPTVKATMLTNDAYRPNRVKRRRNTFIIGAEKAKDGSPILDKPVNKHKKVLVSCSCENAVFMWEYANAAHGAGRLIYSNGEPPVVTNPGLAPGLCKHLAALAMHIIKKDL